MSAEEVKRRLAAGERLTILDVRDPEEVAEWPFPGGVHIPLKDVLRGNVAALPRDWDVIATCAHGNRSVTAAEYLVQRGIRARSMTGGIAAWSRVYDLASIPIGATAEIVQVRRLGKGCLGYLVISGGNAAAIDPSRHIDRYVHAAVERGATITHVIDTHLHADHLSGARALARETGAVLHLNPVEGFSFGGFQPAGDGTEIRMGELTLGAFAAPGHTAGTLIWNVGRRALLTGDVLFLESVGRPDLHGRAEAYALDLYRTLRRLASMDDALLVLPGHMPETARMRYGEPLTETLGAVSAKVGFGSEDQASFVERVRHLPERPPHAEEILEINRTGRSVAREDADTLEEGPNRCAAA